jgi:dolichyl-phosphate-mannose--protein O-mannosyl transferase
MVFLSFQFFRPLTFSEPISDAAFERRALLRTWELKCVRCAPDSPWVIPGTAN